MANRKLTELTAVTPLADGDVFYAVDVSDTTDGSGGTSKKTLLSTIASYLASLAQTLTNKTLTSPVLNTGVSGTAVLDEDNMASDSATKVATQQSVKAYVDTHAADTSTHGVAQVADAADLTTHESDTTTHGATGAVVGTTNTQTLTNKRITPRVVTATDDATAVIDVDVTDQYQLTAIANATEFTVTGTPVNGQKLIIRLKDAGVGKGLTWTGFTAIGVTLPTTTVAGKTHYIGCIYNSATPTWDAVAVVAEA